MNNCVVRLNSRRIVCTLLAMLGILFTSSTSLIAQSTTKDKADYRPAIEKLLALGFPDAKGAKYVKLSTNQLQYSFSEYTFISHYSDKPKIKGNGFYIPNPDKSKPGKFILIGGLELTHSGKRSNTYSSDITTTLSGSIKDTDIRKDIALLKAWILRQAISTDSDWRYYGTQECSVIFGFANLAYHAGYEKEATDLINTLFVNHDYPVQIIDKLINRIAKTQYERSLIKFNETGDWAAYLKALQTLQEKFPRGWDKQPGLSLLIPQVKERVDGKLVPTPKIEGYTFSPTILTLIKSSTEFSKKESNEQPSYFRIDPLFLINAPKKNKSASPIEQLTFHGMDGFIALVALMDDKTLMSSTGSDTSNLHRSSYGGSGGNSAETAFLSLNKPLTRGDKATAIIKEVLPYSRESISSMSNSQLKSLALTWWREHRDDSRIELIKLYLKDADTHMSNLARTLLAENNEESITLLEKGILASSSPSTYYSIVQTLVRKRREKAADFLDSYEKALTKEIGAGTSDDYTTSGSYQITEDGGTKKFIAKLRRYTKPLDTKQLLTNLAKKEANTEDILEQLGVALKNKDITADSAKFVYAAAKTENKEKRALILAKLQQLIYAGDGAASLDAEEDDSSVKPAPKLSEYEIQDWRKLLALKDEQTSHYYHVVNTAQSAAVIISKLFHSKHSYSEIMELSQYLAADEYSQLLYTRAENLLSGKKVDAIPSANQVNDERRKELTKLFTDIKPTDIRPALAKLTISEKLAFAEFSSGIDSIEDTSGYILGFNPQQEKAKMPEPQLEKIQGILTQLFGEKYDANTLDKIAKLALEHHEIFAGSSVTVTPNPTLPGKDFYISPISAPLHDKLEKLEAQLKDGTIPAFSLVTNHSYNDNTTESAAYTSQKSPKISEIQSFIDQNSSRAAATLYVFTQNKENLVKTEAERKSTKNERQKLLDEIYKIHPSLKGRSKMFDAIPLEALKEYHKSITDRAGSSNDDE